TVNIETSFFGRPFNRPVFVINPDQLAFLERDETTYSSTPVNDDKPPEVRSGELLQRFNDVDYEFEEFPPEIKAKEGSKIRKTRVGLISTGDTQNRLATALALLPHEALVAYAKRFLQLNPDDSIALGFVGTQLTPNDMVEFTRPRLADRPIRIEWHRVYQSVMEVAQPNADL